MTPEQAAILALSERIAELMAALDALMERVERLEEK